MSARSAPTISGSSATVEHWGKFAWHVAEEATVGEGRRCEISQGPLQLTILQGQIFDLALDYDEDSAVDGYVPNRGVAEISVDKKRFIIENVEERHTRRSGEITLPTRHIKTVFRGDASERVEMTGIVALMMQSSEMTIRMRNGSTPSVDLRGLGQIIRTCSSVS